ncbi:MAG: phosphopantetheine-binding protein [Rhodobacterales bacterium 17-64-5]|nr:MAG: phosphopantetheine-binding protein [Rhodobacterales bacterium 17-64-5]
MTPRDRILAILAAQALMDPSDLRLEARPAEMGLDSLALVESIFALEEEFDIAIPFNAQSPEASGLDISTLGAVVAAVEALVAAR